MWREAGKAAGLARGQKVDAAFTLDENEFQGRKSLQLILKDVRAPE
jgi:RecJ OB domain